jgi:antitoxin component of MazEF toxin-antitoxin module
VEKSIFGEIPEKNGIILSGTRVSIPKAFAQKMGLREGDMVKLKLLGKTMVVIPVEVKERK